MLRHQLIYQLGLLYVGFTYCSILHNKLTCNIPAIKKSSSRWSYYYFGVVINQNLHPQIIVYNLDGKVSNTETYPIFKFDNCKYNVSKPNKQKISG